MVKNNVKCVTCRMSPPDAGGEVHYLPVVLVVSQSLDAVAQRVEERGVDVALVFAALSGQVNHTHSAR